MPHIYIHVKNLPPGWTNDQRNTAWDAMRATGKQSGTQPAEVTHTRVSLDNAEIILESLFEDDEITREAVVATMAAALGVQPNAVDAIIEYQVLGGEDATWDESRRATLTFLAANKTDWE